jgi:sugar transferase (PEP-CTERM/EpsH1 system associated)
LQNILYLVHRLPYPPNKGDKVRSFNILKHLSTENNVFLGAFVDDVDDYKYIPFVEGFCKHSYFQKIGKRSSFLRSLTGLYAGKALSLNYYSVAKFHQWVNEVVENNKIDAVFIFSSAMGQFVSESLYSRTLVDFVDVDSQKWKDYAIGSTFPISLLYNRESKCLLNYERSLASKSKHSFFVTEKERAVFSNLAPESLHKTSALNNGVDSNFFCRDESYLSPFEVNDEDIIPIVFTGAMDYLPNIDAVIWFVGNVLSELIKYNDKLRFFIVGRNPSKSVINLKSEITFVTGTVKDVRPYLQHATVVVAPLRIARGVQNKILEAMSMAKVVVASVACVQAIDATDGIDIFEAETPIDFIEKIKLLIDDNSLAELIGSRARINILEKYSWDFHLKKIDEYLTFNEAGT